ncbi:MAG: CoB--CoM heterodisulfide reductase iron-sulfur subunit B family protein [Elusimicrobiota bacterium]
MKIPYYPGCTLKIQAKKFEDTAIAIGKQLDVELEELPNWNCCGTVYSLSADNLMYHLAPLRILTKIKKSGGDKVVTLCSMCYNTLKQANLLIKDNPEKKEKINSFLSDEKDEKIDYNGEVEVLHFLEILRQIGFDKIVKKVKTPLNMKIAPYYGCLLTRPKEVAIDDVEHPTILADLLKSLGAQPVNFPYETECCGAYQMVNQPEIITRKTAEILTSAKKRGADAVIVSCPMCFVNLDNYQKDTKIPIYYFTELIAAALK